MVQKLVKYDFKWINKIMLVHFAIVVGITILSLFLRLFEYTNLISIIDKILFGTFISYIFSVFINSSIRIWVKFGSGIYKNEGYLTNTLPMTQEKIFDAKMIAGLLSLLLSLGVIAVCTLLLWFGNKNLEGLKTLLKMIADEEGTLKIVSIAILTIVLIFLEIVSITIIGIFSTIVGHSKNTKKLLRTFVCGGISYILTQIILILSFVIIGIFNPDIQEIFTNNSLSISVYLTLLIVSIIYYLAVISAFYIASKKIFVKGVNVE